MRLTVTKLVFVALLMAAASCKPSCICLSWSHPALSLDDGGWPATSFTAVGDPRSGNWAIDFGPVPLGTQASSAIVLGNDGPNPLNVLEVGAPSDAEFALTLSPGTSILPGSTMEVPVSFKPFSAGQKTAYLVIETDSEPTDTVTLSFSGTGVN